jgi:hypothetical protein
MVLFTYFTLKKAAGSPEILVPADQTTRRPIPDDSIFQRENTFAIRLLLFCL